MQFLYFIPGWKRPVINPDELNRIGLGHVHGGRQPMATLTQLNGEAGLVLTAHDDVTPEGLRLAPEDLSPAPASQIWRPGPRADNSPDGKPAYHVGMWTDLRPTPASLLRKQPIGGVPVRLRGEGEWIVPVAHAKFGHATLPTLLQFHDPSQAWLATIAPEFEAFCGRAQEAYKWLSALYFDEVKPSIAFNDVMAIVVEALAYNYRIGVIELSMLAAVGQAEMWAVVEAVCDWAGLMEMLESRAAKKEGAASA